MTRTSVLLTVGLLAAGLGLATRLPTDLVPTILAVAFAGLSVLMGVLARGEAGRPWATPLALASGAGLLLTPAGHEPWLDLPAIVVALPLLAYFHLILATGHQEVPQVGSQKGRDTRKVLRIMPWVLLAGLAALAPWWIQVLLPDRLAHASELQGPAGPVLVASVAACLLLAYGMALRAARRAPSASAASSIALEPEP